MCFVALKKRSNVFHYLLNSLYPLYRNSSLLCQHGGFISLVHTVLFFFKEEEYPKSNGASVHIPFMTTRPDLAYIRIELQITVKSQSRHISNFLLILILHTRQRDIYQLICPNNPSLVVYHHSCAFSFILIFTKVLGNESTFIIQSSAKEHTTMHTN